jgi:hypothetical protein
MARVFITFSLSEQDSKSASPRGQQLLGFEREKIPYFLSEVQRFRENRALRERKRPKAAKAVRFGQPKSLRKQRDRRGVRSQGEQVRKSGWRSESDCNPTFSTFAKKYAELRSCATWRSMGAKSPAGIREASRRRCA